MTNRFFNVGEEEIIFLKRQWDNLVLAFTSHTTIKEEIFQVLKEKYLEEGRFYHNLSHVKSLLTLFESLEDKIQGHQVIQFSIWFHDAIYDSKRNDNEAESANLASEMMNRLQVNHETIILARDLILATKDHSGKNLPYDAKLFLDMDLAILGSSEEIYKEYSKAIRKEYAWVSASAYREGRQKVLNSFIERDRIFFTDEMQARYERQARKNMLVEIEALDTQQKAHV